MVPEVSHGCGRHGFIKVEADNSLFICRKSDQVVLILLYVDDIIVTGSSPCSIQYIKSILHKEFNMNILRYFLGIEIDRKRDSIHMSQGKYVTDLLKRVNMIDCKPVSTPMSFSKELYGPGHSCTICQAERYRMMVGSLQYLTLTRPDITFAVNQVSQFMQTPLVHHMEAVKRILRYVKGTIHHGVTLWRSDTSRLDLTSGYTDADWAGDPNTRKSVTGYCVYLGASLIAWKSRKQRTVARSSTEAEYRALASTVAEVIWIRKLGATKRYFFSADCFFRNLSMTFGSNRLSHGNGLDNAFTTFN